MIEAIICDWNGTLIKDKYEDEFFKELFKKIIFTYPNFLNILKWHEFWKTKIECEKLYKLVEQKGGSEPQNEINSILDLLNKNIIRNTSISLIEKFIEEYSTKAYKRLDERILRPLKKIQNKKVILGIISSGCFSGIKRTLEKGGYYFNFIIANDFEKENNKIKKFSLKVFRNKKEILKNIFEEKNINKNKTMYIGDDWQDEGCFEEVGFPVISFLANEDFKEKISKRINLFIPKSERDFEKYLEDLAIN